MANSHTLGTDYSPRMWWADIEVPNSPVDMNSWEESACYPQSTFYPLSDGPSIQNHRITMTYFRTCLTCPSRSQALLCFYTLWLISVQPERTFVHLHYLLGGDCPSQTARLKLSFYRITVKNERSSLPRVVSHWWLPSSRKKRFVASHLSCAK